MKTKNSLSLSSLSLSNPSQKLHNPPSPRRVQPVLEHVVRIRAQLAPRAPAAGLHVGARDARVPDPRVARVAAARLFARVREGARGPVVDEALGAGEDLRFFRIHFKN